MEIIKTRTTRCVDCYKCVRRCTMKAIQIKEGHAHVVPERCILDGRCVLVCPQNAKEVFSSIEDVKKMIKNGEKIVLSLAPSFVASFYTVSPGRIYNGLRKLGFYEVEETSIGAFYTAAAYEKVLKKKDFLISTDCPSLVNMVEKYYPQYREFMAPVLSPMAAHGKMLKQAYKELKEEDVKVVFAGPCIAKIDEARKENIAIDGVITFLDIKLWFEEEGIELGQLSGEIEKKDKKYYHARLFPVEGGFLKSAGFNEEFNATLKTITGFENCEEFIRELPLNKGGLKLVEMMVCNEGCINGPRLDSDLPVISRREKIFEYANSDQILPNLFDYTKLSFDLSRGFEDKRFPAPEPTEDDLKIIMARVGKYSKKDELDCGACGYDTCREKARAVFQGMAELEMCLPYMRKKAESRADKIVERDPNGVVLFDKDGKIVQYNSAFKRQMKLAFNEDITGRTLIEVLNFDYFKDITKSIEPISFNAYNDQIQKTFDVVTFLLEDEDLQVGIFVDITQRIHNREKLIQIKKETIEKTHDVINKQMRVVQEIASLLGETTAETKSSLLNLLTVMKEEEEMVE